MTLGSDKALRADFPGLSVVRHAYQRATSSLRPVDCRGAYLVLVLVFVFAPGPIEAQVGVGLGLPEQRVAQAKQQLKRRLAEVIVAAEVEQRRFACLRGRDSLGAVMPEFATEGPLLPDVPLHQPTGIGKAPVADLVDDLVATAAVSGP